MCKKVLLILLILFIDNCLILAFDLDNKDDKYSSSVDSRIKTFVYSQNEVFTVIFSQGYYSYIEFAEGERVKNIAVGDASSWKISPYENKLLIMPFEVSSHTNMIITTTKKRNYIFDLISRPNYVANKHRDTSNSNDSNVENKKKNNAFDFYSEKEDISYVVRFYYPEERDEFANLENEMLNSSQTEEYVKNKPERIIEENDTKYNYIILNANDSINADILPIKLFDDGYLTYFKFSNADKIPRIFIEKGKGGKLSSCKRLLFDGYVIIKGVHKKLFIRYEDNNEVKIINKSL